MVFFVVNVAKNTIMKRHEIKDIVDMELQKKNSIEFYGRKISDARSVQTMFRPARNLAH